MDAPKGQVNSHVTWTPGNERIVIEDGKALITDEEGIK